MSWDNLEKILYIYFTVSLIMQPKLDGPPPPEYSVD